MPLPALIPPALAALGFLLTGGLDKTKRQIDFDPNNNPSLMDWGSTGLATALGGFPGAPLAVQAGGNFLLSGGAGKIGDAFDSDPMNDPSLASLLGTGLATAAPYGLNAAVKATPPLFRDFMDLLGGRQNPLGQGGRPPTPTPSGGTSAPTPSTQTAAAAAPSAAPSRPTRLADLFDDPTPNSFERGSVRPASPAPQPTTSRVYRGDRKLDDDLLSASGIALRSGEKLSGPTAGPLWNQAKQFWAEDLANFGQNTEQWRVNPRTILVRKMADQGLLDSNPELFDIPELQEALQHIASGKGAVPAFTRYRVTDFVNGPEAAMAKFGGPNVEMKAGELKSWLNYGQQGRKTIEDRVRGGRERRGSTIPSSPDGAESFRVFGRNNPPLEVPMGNYPTALRGPIPERPSFEQIAWSNQSLGDGIPSGMRDANAFTRTVEQTKPLTRKVKQTQPKGPARATPPAETPSGDPATVIRQTLAGSANPRQGIVKLVQDGVISAPDDFALLEQVLGRDALRMVSDIVNKQGRLSKNIREVLLDISEGPRVPLRTEAEERAWAGLRSVAERRAFEQQIAQKYGISLNDETLLYT